ncbi:MAG: PEP-CTERM sorting domain-containing protein [Telluria sp.]|nr:PEP-CTERM sorting domain-containing protein [Telluria sp.]
MNFSFPTLRLIAAMLLCTLVTQAQAAWAPYTFAATVNSLFMENPATGERIGVDSSTFPGALVQVGDQLSGAFHYNTDQTPFSFSPQAAGSTSFYLSGDGSSGASFSNASGDFAHAIDSQMIVFVNDNVYSGGDRMSMRFQGFGGGYITSFYITFSNLDGQAWSGSSLPAELNLSDFAGGEASFTATWLRLSDSITFSMSSDITSLNLPPARVPEPSGIYLFLAAIAAATMVARKRHSTVR